MAVACLYLSPKGVRAKAMGMALEFGRLPVFPKLFHVRHHRIEAVLFFVGWVGKDGSVSYLIFGPQHEQLTERNAA